LPLILIDDEKRHRVEIECSEDEVKEVKDASHDMSSKESVTEC